MKERMLVWRGKDGREIGEKKLDWLPHDLRSNWGNHFPLILNDRLYQTAFRSPGPNQQPFLGSTSTRSNQSSYYNQLSQLCIYSFSCSLKKEKETNKRKLYFSLQVKKTSVGGIICIIWRRIRLASWKTFQSKQNISHSSPFWICRTYRTFPSDKHDGPFKNIKSRCGTMQDYNISLA